MTESQKRYDRENTVKFTIKLNCNTDSDLIQQLQSCDNKQGLIKKALYHYLIDNTVYKEVQKE